MKARGSTGPRPLQWQPRRNCWCLAQANKAAFLIEGAAYFAAVREALQRARHSIFILGWDIDSRVKLSREATSDDLPLELGPFLDAVVRRQPGLQAYVLTWDFAALYMTEREALTRYRLQWRTHHRLHFRMDSAHPLGGSHHQKIVVIDDTVAFVGGLDLTQRRWDTPAHIPDDSRRRDPGGEPYSPFHDVQIMVAGAAAAALGTLARRRWQRAGGQCVGPKPSDSDPWPATVKPDLEDVEVAIARTEPAYRGQRAIREIEQLYLDAIAAARDSIYLENQYLTSTTITAALCRRLEEATGPEVLLVLPSYASDWLEQATLDSQRAHRLRQLRQADRFGRLRCYFPQGPGLDEAGVYVHAKVMIVDDNLVRIGSANLSNRSMGLDTECDLAIAADHNTRVRQAILAFRHRLLGQHLGVAPEQVAQQIASHGSLLAAVDSLRRPPHTLQPLPESWLEVLEPYLPETMLADPEQPLSTARALAYFLRAEESESSHGGTAQPSLWRPAGRPSGSQRVPGQGLPTWLEAGAWLGLGLLLDWTPLEDWLETALQHSRQWRRAEQPGCSQQTGEGSV